MQMVFAGCKPLKNLPKGLYFSMVICYNTPEKIPCPFCYIIGEKTALKMEEKT